MNIDAQLYQLASEMATNAQASVSRLEREIFDLEAQIAQIKSQRDSARLSSKRLANFVVKRGVDYQCPSCWIDRGKASILRPIGGGTSTDDFLRCVGCDEKFVVSFG